MDSTLNKIFNDPSFLPYIAYRRRVSPTDGVYSPFPEGLDDRLREALRKRGVERLYSHQAAVYRLIRSGRSTVVVTPTASGKTLCYNLPVLQKLLEDPRARSLYLFPTKALSQDQQSELNELITDGDLPIKVCTYDGDTPESLRLSARDKGRIIISNPDMLHAGVLPNHPKWISFFSALRYIVIDEAHSYRGVFGSHVANVIRRLKRVAAFYGAKPIFILCSATIGNPEELARALIEDDVVLVDNNGAPRGPKEIVIYNPPLLDAVQGIRRSTITESQRWALAFLRAGIKTILFAHSRVRTELIAAYINEAVQNLYTENERLRVEAYRGGLLPNERREIERGLRAGTVNGVVSTNALELGIDIGGLDAAVVAGFPGSFNSFWQQAGRSGRRGGPSAAVFIASSAPLDQYIVRHPEWFFDKPSEQARLDADNPYVLSDHAKCAVFELPFAEDEIFGQDTAALLSYLEESGTVRKTGGRWHWSDRSYPAEGVSLRSASSDNVVIIDITKGRDTVIGEMDRPSAKELLFDNAVYLHRGRQYLVKRLDISNRRCIVEEADVNYYTDALVKTDIKPLSEDESFILTYSDDSVISMAAMEFKCVLGDALVRRQTSKFKKIRFHTHENIGYGEVNQAEEEMQTRMLALLFSSSQPKELESLAWEPARIGRAMRALGDLIRKTAPIYLLCDTRDLGIAERVRDPHFSCPTLYLYDMYPGGTGLVEALTKRVSALLAMALEALEVCPCVSGCPSCVGADVLDGFYNGASIDGDVKCDVRIFLQEAIGKNNGTTVFLAEGDKNG